MKVTLCLTKYFDVQGRKRIQIHRTMKEEKSPKIPKVADPTVHPLSLLRIADWKDKRQQLQTTREIPVEYKKKIQSQCLRSEALPRETVQTPSLEIFKTYQVNVQPYTLFGYLFSAFNHPLLHFVQLPDNSTE